MGNFFKDAVGYVNPVSWAVNPGYGIGETMTHAGLDMYGKYRFPSDGGDDPQMQAMREYNAMMAQEYEENRKLQKEFAQHGVGWMLDDAKTRGLSAMAAIGGRAPQYSPLHSGQRPVIPGQKVDKKVAAIAEISQIINMVSSVMNISNMVKEGALIQARTNSLNQGQTPVKSAMWPGSDGQGDAVRGTSLQGRVIENPVEYGHSSHGRISVQAGSLPSSAMRRTATGLRFTASDDMNKRIQGNIFEMVSYAMRDMLKHAVTGPEPNEYPSPLDHPLPGNQVWRWNHWGNEFQPWDPKEKRYRLYRPNTKFYKKRGK